MLSKIRGDAGFPDFPARLPPFPVLSISFPDIRIFFPANLRTGKSPITRCKQIKNLGENRQKRTKSVRICRFSLLFPCKTGKTGPRPVRSGLHPPPFPCNTFGKPQLKSARNSAFWRSAIRPMLSATPQRFQSREWHEKPQDQPVSIS